MNRITKFIFATLLVFLAVFAAAQTTAAPDASSFPPFQQWMGAVLTGDAATLKSLYSVDPPVQVELKLEKHAADADTGFWLGLKSPTIKADLVRLAIHPDRVSVIIRAAISTGDGRTLNVTEAQGWRKQADAWRIVGVERTDNPQLAQPADMKKNIYPSDADAHAEIRDAEERATNLRKRLLLVFGANWCFDCHVLDLAFQRPDLAPIVAANYEIVHVDLGDDEKKNADLVQQYEIPLDKGIPALAVADSDGKLIVSQKQGEFEDARGLTPAVLAEFLNKWKPAAQ